MAFLIGIDIGTTNTKAGLYDDRGRERAVSSRPTVAHRHSDGYSSYDPEEMWGNIAAAIREAIDRAEAADPGCARRIRAIGITSMAESGLLVDTDSGEAKSPFMPWFDTCSTPQAERMAAESDPFERFRVSGIHGSFKLGLPKLLWLKERMPEAFRGAKWLSASGYIAYRLTGRAAFDYSLAARTYCFHINRKEWDREWIRHFGIDPAVFPDALPSGTALGPVENGIAASLGLPDGVQVAIAGHDHVVASLSVGAVTPEVVYDSMGTAETMVGTLPERELGRREFESGLSYGCHVAEGRMFWMGGNASAGGSVEWIRGVLGDPELSYERLLAELAEAGPEPTGILYFPYLTGAGAPRPDQKARASFIGLAKTHGRRHLLKAVLEGTAYQLQAIREEAERVAGRAIERLVVVGGGTRNPHWLQTKADVLNATLIAPPIGEATLLGAALCAGAGAGVYGSMDEAAQASSGLEAAVIRPDENRHAAYRRLYETGYAPLAAALRGYFRGEWPAS
jgi:sugar (pentulose or hexulose) kinase